MMINEFRHTKAGSAWPLQIFSRFGLGLIGDLLRSLALQLVQLESLALQLVQLESLALQLFQLESLALQLVQLES